MREVLKAKPHFRYNPRCRCGEETGFSKPVWENHSGGMGLGNEYRMLVAPKCPRCDTELRRVADAPLPPPPPEDPPKSFIESVPTVAWVIGGIILFLWFLGSR